MADTRNSLTVDGDEPFQVMQAQGILGNIRGSEMKRFFALVLVALFIFVCSRPLFAGENTEYGDHSAYESAAKRLHDIKKRGKNLSEEELDRLLLVILAETNSLDEKKVQVRKILAWASQLFNRDMDINFGEKENLPPRAETLILKLEEIQYSSPLFGWSASSKTAIQQIIENEADPNTDKLSEQELDKLLLAVWSEDISFKRKKREIGILLYFASKDVNRLRNMPPVIFNEIKKREDLKRAADAEKQEKLRLEHLKEEETREAKRLEFEKERRAKRLKEENRKLRSVKQCSKEWSTRKEGAISGAFGITFGCKFNPDFSIGQGSLKDGTPMYMFQPVNKFRSFNQYFVMITPKTHLVYSIWAIGNIKNTETGKKEQAVIVSLLEQKYGKQEENNLVPNLYDAVLIRQSDRDIMVKVSGVFNDHTIDIRYFDNEIKALAEKERIEIESKKVDSSGF